MTFYVEIAFDILSHKPSEDVENDLDADLGDAKLHKW